MISTLAAEDESDGLTVDGGVPSSVYPGDGDPGAGGAGTGGASPHQHAGRQEWEPSPVQLRRPLHLEEKVDEQYQRGEFKCCSFILFLSTEREFSLSQQLQIFRKKKCSITELS